LKTKLKIIIPVSVAVILLALIVIFNIPHNLNNALNFEDSEWLSITVVIAENVNGQPIIETESFTFEKGTVEFTAINNVLNGYSYNINFARNNGIFDGGTSINMTNITILGENNSSLFLVNTSGANVQVNGMLRRMRENRIIELIDKIMETCGM